MAVKDWRIQWIERADTALRQILNRDHRSHEENEKTREEILSLLALSEAGPEIDYVVAAEAKAASALSESAERLDIDPDQMVAWLKLWWSEDEFWRGMRRSSGFGPDVAHLMRGVADMIDGQQQSASDDAKDAARYRWLRERVTYRDQETLSPAKYYYRHWFHDTAYKVDADTAAGMFDASVDEGMRPRDERDG